MKFKCLASIILLSCELVHGASAKILGATCFQLLNGEVNGPQAIREHLATEDLQTLESLIRASGLEPELHNLRSRARGLLTIQQFLKYRASSHEPGYLLGLTGGYRSTYQAIAEVTQLTTWWKGFEQHNLTIGWENNGYFMDSAAREHKQIYILIPDALTTQWAQSYSHAELIHALRNSEIMKHTTLVFGSHRLLGMIYENNHPTRMDNEAFGPSLKNLIKLYSAELGNVQIPDAYADRFRDMNLPRANYSRVTLTEVPKELRHYVGMKVENGVLKQNIVQGAENIFPPLLWELNAPLAEGYINVVLTGEMTPVEYAARFHDVWINHNRHRIKEAFAKHGLNISEMGIENIKREADRLTRDHAEEFSSLDLKMIAYFKDYPLLGPTEKNLELEKVNPVKAALARSNNSSIVAIYDLATGVLHRSWLKSYSARHGQIPRFHPVPLSFIPETLSELDGVELRQGVLYKRDSPQ